MKQPTLDLGTCSAIMDGPYRYRLDRIWDAGKACLAFIMLNPSTADETDDDPTLRRCLHFAQRGAVYGGLIVVNLFAWRATDPSDLIREEQAGTDVVGPKNDEAVRTAATVADDAVCAWGAMGGLFPARANHVLAILREIGAKTHSLGLTKNRSPKHPLYLPNHTALTPFCPEGDHYEKKAP